MQKIISLFERDWQGDRLVRNEVTPGAEWVIAGEGVATRKWDGTCCMVRDGRLYKRREVKANGKIPPDFEPVTGVDIETGKQYGWVPVGDGPEDVYHREAWGRLVSRLDGTYELVGPKIQGGAEAALFERPALVRHGIASLFGFPREFDAIRECLRDKDMEGVVWHHPDGRMVKIKRRDFWTTPRPRASA